MMKFLVKVAVFLVAVFFFLPEGYVAKRVAWYKGENYLVSRVGVASVRGTLGEDKVLVELLTDKKRKYKLQFVVEKGKVVSGHKFYTYLTPENKLKYCRPHFDFCLN